MIKEKGQFGTDVLHAVQETTRVEGRVYEESRLEWIRLNGRRRILRDFKFLLRCTIRGKMCNKLKKK